MQKSDFEKAERAYFDVVRQGLPEAHPTRIALKVRYDRYRKEEGLGN